MFALEINILFYFISIVFFYRKDHSFSIRVAILFLYLIFAIMGYYIVQTGIFFVQFGHYNISDVSILPYVFNFLFILLLMTPFRFLRGKESKCICSLEQIKSKRIMYFERLVIILCFGYLFVGVLWFYKYGTADFVDIYTSNREGEHEYVFSNRLLNIFFFRTFHVLRWITPFWCMIEFSKLINRIKMKQALFYLVVFFICLYIGCIVGSNRGGMIFTSTNLIFFIIIEWKYLSPKIRRTIIVIGCIAVIFIVMSLLSITLSRSDNDSDVASFGVIRYFGESFPNLGIRVWGASDEHIWGARKFPFLFQLFGGYIPDFNGDKYVMVDYFERMYKYPVNNFKTFFGDIYAEFGIVVSFLIVCLYVWIVNLLIKKTSKSNLYVIFIYETYTLLTWGLFNCNISQDFVVEFLLYVIIVFFIKNHKVKKKKV